MKYVMLKQKLKHGTWRLDGSRSKMGWTKRIKVPAEHKTFAPSYRYGYKDAEQRRPMKKESYFSNEGARKAYKSGYRAGAESMRELDKEINNEWLR